MLDQLEIKDVPTATGQTKAVNLAPFILVLFALIVSLHLGSAFMGKALIRAAHLGVALNYAEGSIDPFHPVMPGFNATGTPTALEFPIWQAAAGLAFKITHSTWYGWANLVSLMFFATGVWPFFKLARQYTGERAAWWTIAFFLAQPLIIIMAGEAATDGFCLVVILWFLFFADQMIRTGNAWYWLPTTLFGMVAAISKLPFFMAAGLCSLILLSLNGVRSWRIWALLALSGIVAAVTLSAWTHYTDSLAAQAEYPYYELRLSQNPNLAHWFFGDLHSRLNPGLWVKGGWRFLHATLGSLPFAGLLLLGLLRPGNLFPKLWLAATFLVTLVFTPIVLNHWHYYLMCSPAVALLCGAMVARWESFWAQEMPRPWMRFSIALAVLIFSAIDGLIAMKISIDYDYFPKEISALLRQHTKPSDKLIVCGEATWGGEVLFRAGRNGLSVYDYENQQGVSTSKGLFNLLGNEKDLQRLKQLGYNKLVLLSESPVRFAVQAANPGAKRTRIYYPKTISKTVDAWPVVYRSDDLLIRDIP
jgi:hypothetical protein